MKIRRRPRNAPEPADLQHGEVEVDGHNLYFNEWDLQTDVETKPVNPD